jgi:hypothetical protein
MMQITINVPDWMAKDYEVRTGTKFDASVVGIAARAYYGRLFDPVYNQKLPHQTLVAIYGDD